MFARLCKLPEDALKIPGTGPCTAQRAMLLEFAAKLSILCSVSGRRGELNCVSFPLSPPLHTHDKHMSGLYIHTLSLSLLIIFFSLSHTQITKCNKTLNVWYIKVFQ